MSAPEVDPTNTDSGVPPWEQSCEMCGVSVLSNRLVPMCSKCGDAFLSELLGNLGMVAIRPDGSTLGKLRGDT